MRMVLVLFLYMLISTDFASASSCVSPEQLNSLKASELSQRLSMLSTMCAPVLPDQNLTGRYQNLRAQLPQQQNLSGSQETALLNSISSEFSSSLQNDVCEQTNNILRQLEANPSADNFNQLAQQNSTYTNSANLCPTGSSNTSAPEFIETQSSSTGSDSSTGTATSSPPVTSASTTPPPVVAPPISPTSAVASPSVSDSSSGNHPQYNAGTGALKIIASLYRSCDAINLDFNITDLRNSLPESQRPIYNQGDRNPKFQRSSQGYSMDVMSSDCSSFVSASILAGGLKWKKNMRLPPSEIPTTASMMEWRRDNQNNCFEEVEFDDNTPAIQVGDIYVNSGTGRHVVVITSVQNENDPLGFSGLSLSDCDDPNLMTKLSRGGTGPYTQIGVAQNSGDGPENYRATWVNTEMVRLACRAHFGGRRTSASITIPGTSDRESLFRVKHDTDGSIPDGCRLSSVVTPTNYNTVSQCFREN